ncbi:2'-5' RNA ligase family protein [Aquipseudomonas guryensis]|jgi:2'-5' RNA ligase|uniref:2'-5' RNA ligase family protein n=1 Tax=Aquipseudomonas guryensis TaxID=2759165 RepID=A0A7W4DCF7_9GAMM|nr:2'-5' RNA ligase family protein [Pseudomonas guryensis]MBB1520067.1 2'-5' RNA ligase family protein [Pseudomonas guryensis]
MRFSTAHNSPTHTQICELRDYPEWHCGRKRYGLWAIPVGCPAVLARMQAARELLGDWLHPGYLRQAHITLFVCGFEALQRRYDDDFCSDQLQRQREDLQRLPLAPFELQIGRLDSFSSAAFLQVDDPQRRLQPLRDCLTGHAEEIRQSPYLPHLTLGLYRQSISAQAWRERAAALSQPQPLHFTVHELHYCTYQADQLFGPLRYDTCVPLAIA